MLLVFDDHERSYRVMNKRHVEMLTNACFSELNHEEGLMSIKQRIKSKISNQKHQKKFFSENKVVIMLYCPGNIKGI